MPTSFGRQGLNEQILSLTMRVLSKAGFHCFFFQHVYEDSMDLIAKLTTVAAIIYRNLYRDGTSVGTIDHSKDWSWNFAEMLSYENAEFVELMRLYLTIHR